MTKQSEPTLTIAEVADRLTMRLDAVHRRIAAGELAAPDGRVTESEFQRFRDAVMDAMVAACADDIEADLRENYAPPPREVAERYAAGDITREEMLSDLGGREYTYGYSPEPDSPTSDAYVRGTWDEVVGAAVSRLITEADYQEIRRRVAEDRADQSASIMRPTSTAASYAAHIA